jgi:hypothetical protein
MLLLLLVCLAKDGTNGFAAGRKLDSFSEPERLALRLLTLLAVLLVPLPAAGTLL